MKVVLSLLMFSVTLFLSHMVFASDLLIPPTYCIKETGPGLYLWLGDDGSLSGRLSLSNEDKVKDVKDGQKAASTDRFSFFLGPDLGTVHNDMGTNIAAGLPPEDNSLSSRFGSDYGVQCGFTWKFK